MKNKTNKERIAEIIEQTREDSQIQFSDCHNEKAFIEIILKLVEINHRQIGKRGELIHYYRNKIEVINNYIDIQEEDNQC